MIIVQHYAKILKSFYRQASNFRSKQLARTTFKLVSCTIKMVNFCTLINIVKHHLHVWFLNCSCSNSSTGVASMGRDNVGAQRVENCPLSPLPRQAAGGGGAQVEQSLLIISFKVLTSNQALVIASVCIMSGLARNKV